MSAASKKLPKNIVVLTGSGVSAESGVSTFRDKEGIWAKYDYREVATPEGFAANPGLVHEFYNDRRKTLQTVKPNAAHAALADLQQLLSGNGGSLTLVTQNVDDLHERGGATSIIHMHGELLRALCGDCGGSVAWTGDLNIETVCPTCDRQGAMRPDVVWFGEIPRFMDEIADAIMGADLFVSIGTSGSVYPAAGFAMEARAIGVPVMELNLEPSENAHILSGSRYGPATGVVPEWVSELIGNKVKY